MKKNTKKAKLFVCHFCKEASREIGNSCNTDIIYLYNVSTQHYKKTDEICGDQEWFCVNCDHDLSDDDVKEFIN